MPPDILNSPEWRMALASAAGTGRDHEQERMTIIMDWMWGTVLPQLQPLADEQGFGDEWRGMCNEKTGRDARNAATAARDATAERAAADAAYAARAAAAAARAADAARAAREAAWAAARAAAAAARADADDFWSAVDPIGLLNKLNAVGYDR